MSIRARLFLTFFLVVGMGFAVLVHWIIDDLRPRYLETMEESMVDTATLLSSLLAADLDARASGSPCPGPIDPSPLRAAFADAGRRRLAAKIYDVTKTRLDMRVYVTDDRGIVVFDSDGGRDEGADYSRWNDVRRTLGGSYGARTSRIDPGDPRSFALYVASPIERAGRTVGVLTVSKPSASVGEFLAAARRKIAIAGIAAALAAIGLGMVVAARIAGPIRKLTGYAEAVRDGRRVPLPPLGGREVRSLGVAFDEMREALEGKQYVEDYVAALTHEMKSPLSAIRGAAELLEDPAMLPGDRRRFLGHVRTEAARMQDVIDRLLELSSLEKRGELRDVEEIDLRETLRDVVAAMESVLSAKRLSIAWVRADGVRVRGERFLVRQSLSNLLQNAADFSPAGGTIEVLIVERGGANGHAEVDPGGAGHPDAKGEVGADAGGAWAEVQVRDGGPGVPDYALARVFERFYSLVRPDTGKKGSGLGLTFVREAVALHGGEAWIENTAGGGARAVLRLPVAPVAGRPGNLPPG